MSKSGEFSSPVLRTIDELEQIPDVGLTELEGYCRAFIGRGRSQGFSTRNWEEELCYIQREQEIRKNREIVHKQWLEEHPHMTDVDYDNTSTSNISN